MATRTPRRIRRERHYTDPLSVRLRPDQLVALEALGDRLDRSVNALIRDAVALYLDAEVTA